jgi:hypothetical protein
MVYGVVQYDFNAERPDELEAKAGEAIIVIAQSTPEWFVAKPIGRLGGPGLIPVSFIEIKDMSTGQTVTDPQEAVRRAGVPKVEEWKKMAAEYKNSSIALGRLDTAQSGVTKDMGRMSLQGGSQERIGTSNGYVSCFRSARCHVLTRYTVKLLATCTEIQAITTTATATATATAATTATTASVTSCTRHSLITTILL